MKAIKLTFAIAFIVGVMSCQKDSDLLIELSLEDQIATVGMEEAFEAATAYNDSLVSCADSINNCGKTVIKHLDSLYHYHNDLYETHHSNYSHNNVEDDHHHSSMSEHHHGDAEHGGEETGEDHHGHSQESHQDMENLREVHKLYHPK